MIVHAWRIFKPQHAATALTGEGARRFGGRWNSKGVPIIYAAGSQALAALEMLVHLSSAEMLQHYQFCRLTFNEALIESIDIKALPKDWRNDPGPKSLRSVGDQWFGRARRPVLLVPSTIVPDEFNYLINPSHRDFSKVKIGPIVPFQFDRRLIK